MLSITDAPEISKEEGEEILEIPARIERELGQVIIQCRLRILDQDESGDNVQILGRVVSGSKEQLITLAHNGLVGIKQELDQATRERRRQMAIVCRECMGIFGESH